MAHGEAGDARVCKRASQCEPYCPQASMVAMSPARPAPRPEWTGCCRSHAWPHFTTEGTDSNPTTPISIGGDSRKHNDHDSRGCQLPFVREHVHIHGGGEEAMGWDFTLCVTYPPLLW